MAQSNLLTRLHRLQRDIMVEKRLRQQKKRREENITDVTERIDELRKQCREIINQMETEQCD